MGTETTTLGTTRASAPQAPAERAAGRALRDTHEVTNQPPPLRPYNSYSADPALREAVAREGASWAQAALEECGALAGSVEAWEHAERAERNEPRLVTHDRYGHRIDRVECDPSWHWLLREAIERGMAGMPWREQRPGAHVARAALFFLWTQVSSGVMCPVSMTYAAVPALRVEPQLAERWVPLLTACDYERGALCGMAMTEKQGGSDVRANTTRALPVGDGSWELWGHKWFCSYPPCDIFLTLAHTERGLTCFLFESDDPGFRLVRLKDKLGTRSLPSAEVEYWGVRAQMVGAEGEGVKTIIRMVNHTRLDCMIGSAGGMRAGLVEALHHARHRRTFGRRLVDWPAMQNVLADLAIESEAATIATLRVARAYDEEDAPLRRFATAVMKYWICKRAPIHAAEALECLGGNGYVEESGMPRLYRDAPINSIWEGSGNVAALDVLRAMSKEPAGLEAFLEECERARGADQRLDRHLAGLRGHLARLARGELDAQWAARRTVEDLALAFQASLLVRHAPAAVADAFCAGRLSDERGRVLGVLPAGVDAAAIIERAYPT
ncbi:putative acyl-CoA dehydrogenase [Thermoleophilum album]|uniref:Putative acyl-CoA dehydrogenase n=1 Tax=Thermoleophilum album TaxID=29539 RepID=A0A1H6FHI8_THEAL|nr:putative acyl-CoA dehydrogenase [Thermoleophilum album]